MTGARPMNMPLNPHLTLILLLATSFGNVSAQAQDAPAISAGEGAWISYADGAGTLLTLDAANRPRNGPNPWSVAKTGTRVTFQFCDGTARTLIARDFY